MNWNIFQKPLLYTAAVLGMTYAGLKMHYAHPEGYDEPFVNDGVAFWLSTAEAEASPDSTAFYIDIENIQPDASLNLNDVVDMMKEEKSENALIVCGEDIVGLPFEDLEKLTRLSDSVQQANGLLPVSPIYLTNEYSYTDSSYSSENINCHYYPVNNQMAVSYGAIKYMNMDGLQFAIAHELGHKKRHQLLCHADHSKTETCDVVIHGPDEEDKADQIGLDFFPYPQRVIRHHGKSNQLYPFQIYPIDTSNLFLTTAVKILNKTCQIPGLGALSDDIAKDLFFHFDEKSHSHPTHLSRAKEAAAWKPPGQKQ